MKMIKYCILLLVLLGCDQAILDPPRPAGKVELIKIDGQITQVSLSLYSGRIMRDRRTIDKQINALKKLVISLESARDEMPVVEPPLIQQTVKTE